MPQHPVRLPDWVPAAPIRTSVKVEIAASPATVWEFIADHENWPQWFTAVERVEVTGNGSGVGGTRRVVIQRLPFDEVFTAWEEGREFSWAVTGSRLPILAAMAETMRLEATDTGCHLAYEQGLEARRGFGRVLDVMWQRNGPMFQEALENLGRLAEAED